MADIKELPRIERNVRKLIDLGAPTQDIDSYLGEEGHTADTFRASMLERKAQPMGLADKLRAGTNAVIQGGTFGLSDEIAGAGAAAGRWLRNLTEDSGVTPGQAYDKTVEGLRGEQKRFHAENPVTAGGLEIAGALATAPVSLAAGAARVVANPLMNVAKQAMTGAALGGAAGAGHAEGGLGERLDGAGTGAAAGGIIGGAAPLVASAASKVAGPVLNILGLRNADKAATDQILRAFERDGVSIADAQAKLQAWQKAGAKPEMLAELGGENVKQLAATVANVPGGGKAAAQVAMTERTEGQGARIYEDLNKTLKPELFHEAEDKIVARLRSKDVRDLYDDAYAAGPSIRSPEVNAILETPAGRQAFRRAVNLMRNEQLPIGPTDATGMARGLSTQTLDYVKRGLDDMIGVNVRAGEKNNVRILQGLKERLVHEVDIANPAYAKARAEYAGDAEVLNALRSGREFLKSDPEQIALAVKNMSTAERWAHDTGVARALKDIIDRTQDGADATRRIFGNTAMRDKIRAAIPDEKAFGQLESALNREAEMAATNRMVSPRAGSQTARLQAGMDDMKSDPVGSWIDKMSSGLHPSAAQSALNVARDFYRRGQGINSETADKMGGALFQTNATRNLDTLNNLAAQQAAARLADQRRMMLAATLRNRAAMATGGQFDN